MKPTGGKGDENFYRPWRGRTVDPSRVGTWFVLRHSVGFHLRLFTVFPFGEQGLAIYRTCSVARPEANLNSIGVKAGATCRYSSESSWGYLVGLFRDVRHSMSFPGCYGADGGVLCMASPSLRGGKGVCSTRRFGSTLSKTAKRSSLLMGFER